LKQERLRGLHVRVMNAFVGSSGDPGNIRHAYFTMTG
jgi:hypothetical protein